MFWYAPSRDVFRVHGADAVSYLHSQLSQAIGSMAVGESTWSFVLQPTGKVEALLRVWRTGDQELVVDTDGGSGDVLLARLNRFKIRVKVEIEPLDWHCVALRGDVVDRSVLADSVVAWGGGADLLGVDVTPPPGVPAGTADDYLDARIAAGWPAMGTEIVPGETIPAETGVAASAVSFTKGCYPGQELVERMDSRGSSAPFHLVVLDRSGADAVGDDVLVDGAAVGTITSVGSRQVLARVRRNVEVVARS